MSFINFLDAIAIPLGILIIILNLLVVVLARKKISNPKYQILFQYFLFELLGSLLSTVLSVVFEIGFISRNLMMVAVHLFIFIETCSDFLIFFMWIYLMWERKLIGCTTATAITTPTSQTDARFYNFKKIMNVYRWHIALGGYYVLNFSLNVYLLTRALNSSWLNLFERIFVTGQILIVVLIPLVIVIFFWRFFGGSQDPILLNSTRLETNLIKFVKVVYQ